MVIIDKDIEECIYIDCLFFCIILSKYLIVISYGLMYSV